MGEDEGRWGAWGFGMLPTLKQAEKNNVPPSARSPARALPYPSLPSSPSEFNRGPY